MEQKKLKKILACYSIAGLLTAAVFTTGCSKQEDIAEKSEDQETSQRQPRSVDVDPEKSKKPDGTEVEIRGKSG